ncbi:hypothetical protein AAHC03_05868 [Spirometra sp. Aus1]
MECSPEAARNAAFSEFGTDASTDAASTVGSGLSDPGPLQRQHTAPQLASNGSPLLGGFQRNFRSSITNRLRFKSRPADRTKTFCLPHSMLVIDCQAAVPRSPAAIDKFVESFKSKAQPI